MDFLKKSFWPAPPSVREVRTGNFLPSSSIPPGIVKILAQLGTLAALSLARVLPMDEFTGKPSLVPDEVKERTPEDFVASVLAEHLSGRELQAPDLNFLRNPPAPQPAAKKIEDAGAEAAAALEEDDKPVLAKPATPGEAKNEAPSKGAPVEVAAPRAAGKPSTGGYLLLDWAKEHDEVLKIQVRRLAGQFHPIRGDIALFESGDIGIVTVPRCGGCGNFRMVSFTPQHETEIPPSIYEREVWSQGLIWLLRICLPDA